MHEAGRIDNNRETLNGKYILAAAGCPTQHVKEAIGQHEEHVGRVIFLVSQLWTDKRTGAQKENKHNGYTNTLVSTSTVWRVYR